MVSDKVCFMCGTNKNITRHHVIPKAFKPVKNITIPLCEAHKDVTHPVFKQVYTPAEIRSKLSLLNVELDKCRGLVKSIKADLKHHKKADNNKLAIPSK